MNKREIIFKICVGIICATILIGFWPGLLISGFVFSHFGLSLDLLLYQFGGSFMIGIIMAGIIDILNAKTEKEKKMLEIPVKDRFELLDLEGKK